MNFTLDDPPFANRTGNDVKIAVLDSGVHSGHPHVGEVRTGRSFIDGDDERNFVDRVGHGTAVAAAIREKSPGAELVAVRIFDRRLATSVGVLADAIVWSAEAGARLINLSLGTANFGNAEPLNRAIEHARARGSLVVSARESNGTTWLPGALEGVAGVVADTNCERHELAIIRRTGGLPQLSASPFPRPIPGVPRERNVHGVSFAVANATGFLARAVEAAGGDPFEAIRQL